MPSPFPGMDPYLEHPDFWQETHNRLIVAIAESILVEIDLLRRGEAMPILNNSIQSDYRVLISRSNRRPLAELYAFNLPDSLPIFLLPLREEDVEPIVNLQELLTGVYDRAGYDYRIDYHRDPIPSLSEQNLIWAKELLQSIE
ncbi:hypothetical protein BCD67_01315 [Oscillatoriales cyanobacterium USR001]|nr:hypothetical protein BCD67_01315 [Oscillatoriales cyanobacterium USR001]